MKILISGEGGQGVQIISEILAKVANKNGKIVSYMPQFGVEQRGGASVAFLQISDKKIIYPKFVIADLVIVMSNRAISAVESRISENTIFLFDSSNIDDKQLQPLRGKI